MRISNMGGVSLSPVSPQNICSITSADDLGAVTYQVTGSNNGHTLSGQVPNLQFVDVTPQGNPPYQITLEYPDREVGAVTVSTKSADATIGVVYVSPSGSYNDPNPTTINGPYAWITTAQSA